MAALFSDGIWIAMPTRVNKQAIHSPCFRLKKTEKTPAASEETRAPRIGKDVMSCWKVSCERDASAMYGIEFTRKSVSNLKSISAWDELARVSKDDQETRHRLESSDHAAVESELEVGHGNDAADGETFPV